MFNNYRRNWVVTGIKRNGANWVNGQNQQKQKQKLSPITRFDFNTNSHIGLFCYGFFVLFYMGKKELHLNWSTRKRKKQTKWNTSCPEEALVYGGCQKSQNSRPCSHVPHAQSVLFLKCLKLRKKKKKKNFLKHLTWLPIPGVGATFFSLSTLLMC